MQLAIEHFSMLISFEVALAVSGPGFCNCLYVQRILVELICSFFCCILTGVVKYHGPRPSIRPKQVL
ncbi:hypothetical protein HAX54_051891 [Datura stramonium]|uniref:Uncharacterized protein n=1 Tax=Datura stramonium TaxID=4076 RepID=A0ABS8SYU8_DATST|nr:hypothetical protein [Datura stramonium]